MQPLANPTQSAQARLGSMLGGKWRLERILGIGGVATVYLATHRNRSRAALKLLHREQTQNSDVRERFVHEGYAANSIDHPGVVKVLDDDVTEDGLPFLVMELLEGETLDARAERLGDRLAPGEVLALVDQLLDVLAVAHAENIVHRDLKPDNLFLTRSGRLKVLDFGIARLRQNAVDRDVTAVGTLLGTPAFMPPEQARSRWEEVDARSDLYSVGATMFNLLTGRLIREAETLTEQLALAIHEPAPKLASVDSTQHAAVCAIVDRALAYERTERFPSARAMQEEVQRAREVVPPPATSSVSPVSSRSASAAYAEPTLLESGRRPDAPRASEVRRPMKGVVGRRLAAFLLLALLAGLAVAAGRSLQESGRSAGAVSAPVSTQKAPERLAEKPSESSVPVVQPAPPASAAGVSNPRRSTASVLKAQPAAPRVGASVSAPSPPSPALAPAAVDDPLSKRY